MATAHLIPVSEYLATVYRPDCEYVEGHGEERALGDSSHATLAFVLAKLLDANRTEWGIRVIPEVRVQVAEQRYRVPDITVMRRSDPQGEVIRTPPLICIEVLFPQDGIQRMQERFRDYFRMGVPHVWLVDPLTPAAWVAEPDGSLRHVGDELGVPRTPIRIILADVYAELDERQRQD